MAALSLDELIAQATILVVDDEIFNLRLVERFLRSIGYVNVIATSDSREVAQLQFRHDFDLVLSDVEMPHLNGFDVIKLLNARRTKDDYLPILVVRRQRL